MKHIVIADDSKKEIDEIKEALKELGETDSVIFNNKEESSEYISKNKQQIDLIIASSNIKRANDMKVNTADYWEEELAMYLMQSEIHIPIIIVYNDKNELAYEDDNVIGKVNTYYNDLESSIVNILKALEI